jgi:hypothetical protein
MNKYIDNEIDLRLKNSLNYNTRIYKSLIKEAKNFFSPKEYSLFSKRLNIIKKIKKFKINHPIRVAYYSLKFLKKNNKEICLLGLFHNLLETNMPEKKLSQYLDKKTIRILNSLYVKKELRWDKNYLKGYYLQLNKSGILEKKLKCIDKFDNLFNLKNNADIDIKKNYLAEIETYIIPLVKKNIPELKNSFNRLLKLNYSLL